MSRYQDYFVLNYNKFYSIFAEDSQQKNLQSQLKDKGRQVLQQIGLSSNIKHFINCQPFTVWKRGVYSFDPWINCGMAANYLPTVDIMYRC